MALLKSALFILYAGALVFAARWVVHAAPSSWRFRRLLFPLTLAAGLWPWAKWLHPRVKRVLDFVGYAVLSIAYFTVLWPFALIVRARGNPLANRSAESPNTSWLSRVERTTQIADAQVEY